MLAWDSCPPSCWHHVAWFLPGHSSRISADRASVAHGAHLSLKPLSGLSTCTFTESNVSSYWCLWPWGVDRAHCSLPYLSICIFSFQQWEVFFFFFAVYTHLISFFVVEKCLTHISLLLFYWTAASPEKLLVWPVVFLLPALYQSTLSPLSVVSSIMFLLGNATRMESSVSLLQLGFLPSR